MALFGRRIKKRGRSVVDANLAKTLGLGPASLLFESFPGRGTFGLGGDPTCCRCCCGVEGGHGSSLSELTVAPLAATLLTGDRQVVAEGPLEARANRLGHLARRQVDAEVHLGARRIDVLSAGPTGPSEPDRDGGIGHDDAPSGAQWFHHISLAHEGAPIAPADEGWEAWCITSSRP